MSRTNYFVTACNFKISKCIRHLISGLEKAYANEIENFAIDMDVFGDVGPDKNGKQICFGCAATATIIDILEPSLDPDAGFSYLIERVAQLTFNLEASTISPSDVMEFDEAIDCFRRGDPDDICDLFNKPSLRSYINNLMNDQVDKMREAADQIVAVCGDERSVEAGQYIFYPNRFLLDTKTYHHFFPALKAIASDLESLDQ